MRAGTRLGLYEITSSLGAGGMGEVYRARDGRSDETSRSRLLLRTRSTPQARERFEREARSVAGLQHPNICRSL